MLIYEFVFVRPNSRLVIHSQFPQVDEPGGGFRLALVREIDYDDARR